MKLLFTFVQYHQSDKVIKELNKLGVDYSIVLKATGTAPSEIMDMLNLTDSRRECIISLVESARCQEILNTLNEKLKLFKAGQGVSFATSLNSISKNTLNLLQTLGGEKNE